MSGLTDDDIMPFGKFKGERLQDVPDDYLYWLHKELKSSYKKTIETEEVYEYISDNIEAIKENIKRNRKLFKYE